MRRMICKHALLIMLPMSFAMLSPPVIAQSSCVASNDNEDQICNVSCPVGQTASCNAGVGSSAPRCSCSSASLSRDPVIRAYRQTSESSASEQ
ncbi:hypothetical protein BX592_108110 [Paraburkholderia rhizosphaerae]|uniref:Uncharacterized protein n=1 Tax=Paraburkholderia rhizosphaerae TaxID=480658 RepID=A0A4R8LT63_9BURK|nr:hypothetical protein BX592_108110 [Paraburkholderia rhizosphaerae]